jgi:hypothetical protein
VESAQWLRSTGLRAWSGRALIFSGLETDILRHILHTPKSYGIGAILLIYAIYLVLPLFQNPQSGMGDPKTWKTRSNLHGLRYVIQYVLTFPDGVAQLDALKDARSDQDVNDRLISILVAHTVTVTGRTAVTDGWGHLFKINIEPAQPPEAHGVDQIVIWSTGPNGVNKNGKIFPKLIIKIPLRPASPQSLRNNSLYDP